MEMELRLSVFIGKRESCTSASWQPHLCSPHLEPGCPGETQLNSSLQKFVPDTHLVHLWSDVSVLCDLPEIAVLRKRKWIPPVTLTLRGCCCPVLPALSSPGEHDILGNHFLKPLPNLFNSNYSQSKTSRRCSHVFPTTRSQDLCLWYDRVQWPLPWGPGEAAGDVSPHVSTQWLGTDARGGYGQQSPAHMKGKIMEVSALCQRWSATQCSQWQWWGDGCPSHLYTFPVLPLSLWP